MDPFNRLRHLIDKIRLGLDTTFYTEYLRRQGVRIGGNSRVIYPSYIDAGLPYLVEIGDNVTISMFATILAHDATTAYAGDLVKIGKVVICDRCFIGANSTIVCNVRIGPNSIVGAGSVVTHDIPPDTVCAGNPARVVCSTSEFEEKHRESGSRLPLFALKKGPQKHEVIQEVRDALENTFGYCCSELPRQNKKRS
ncbi:MAG TPA: acyltransferase [Deltaproteobacteria bacterium]|nr:acyltransferase [Deltaproteobacteria bacterium]